MRWTAFAVALAWGCDPPEDVEVEIQCNDAFDNDGDGDIDCADPDCSDACDTDSDDTDSDDTDSDDTDSDDTETPPSLVDVLVIMDNSASMEAEASAWLQSVPQMMAALSDLPPGTVRFAATSVDVIRDNGIWYGPAGGVDGSSENAARDLTRTVACYTSCFVGGLPQGVSCPADAPSGFAGCGTGPRASEEPLEAAYLAACRGVPSSSVDCFSPWWFDDSAGAIVDSVPATGSSLTVLQPSDLGGPAEGWYREDASTVVIVVTDEGDQSRRLAQGSDDPSTYQRLYGDVPRTYQWHVFGPELENCNLSGAAGWGVQRLQTLVDASGGTYTQLQEFRGGQCQQADLSNAAAAIGQAILELTR